MLEEVFEKNSLAVIHKGKKWGGGRIYAHILISICAKCNIFKRYLHEIYSVMSYKFQQMDSS